MSQVTVERELKKRERNTSLIIWICSAALLIFLVWAHFAVLDEVTVGTGKVTPSTRAQVIESLDGGIVNQLNV
ncbi:MAG: secretion protein HlyD, partial [Mixta calida]|nr:secretion protein HlyD [Mixta calida]